jgi:hypothetical protein
MSAPVFAFDADDRAAANPVNAVARFRRQNERAQKVIIAGIFVLLIGLSLGAGFYLLDGIGGTHRDRELAAVDSPPVEKMAANGPMKAERSPGPLASEIRFPRRLLAITVHQYLYADSTSPFAPSLSPGRHRRLLADALRELAVNKLHTDPSQVYVLSDALRGQDHPPPLKPIVEQTIERFLGTCRPQDRIMLVFVGHALDLDGQPYLVPLEGDLTDKESLIPLKWLYDRLATCPARQKVLVLDVCRRDSARGQERPGSGPLGPLLDAALANPPMGVQVWTACTARQFSYEYDFASAGNFAVEGGAFLSLVAQAFQQGAGAPKPEDPLPLTFLTEQVPGPLRRLTEAREKAAQTPRLAGREPAAGAAFDPDQPLPPRFELPRPSALVGGGVADPKEVQSIFAEVAVPPLKLPRDLGRTPETPEQQAARLAVLFPYSAAALKPYAADYKHLREVLMKPDKFPLRIAVIRAVEALDRQGRFNRVKVGEKEEQADRLIGEFRGQTTDGVKKSLSASQQAGPAKMLVELQDVLEEMEKTGAVRDQESSKRWQAHYDYILAQLKARMVYVQEYNFMLGKVKRDELPPLDPALHNGWRLASQEKIQSPKDVRELADDARKLLNKIIKEHPGTPWEVLAKRERFTSLGLAWQPSHLGN